MQSLKRKKPQAGAQAKKKKATPQPAKKKCTIERNMAALQRTTDFGDLPVFYPTVSMKDSDYAVLVNNLNNEDQGVILVHREHLCNNLQYFKAMVSKSSATFRESSKSQAVLVTKHSPELINEYFKTIYDGKFFFTTENCLAFYHIADYYNDESMLPSCIAFIKENMREEWIFDLLEQTSAFDFTCVEFVKANGISDISQHRTKIGRLSAMQLKIFLPEIQGSISPVEKIGLLSYWIEVHPDCIEVVKSANYSDLTRNDRFDFLQFLKSKFLNDDDFNSACNHIISANHITADRLLQRIGQNRQILTGSNCSDAVADLIRMLASKKVKFRIGRHVDQYLLSWQDQWLKWVPPRDGQELEFILDLCGENLVIRHATYTDLALTARSSGHQPKKTTEMDSVTLSQWVGNGHQQLHLYTGGKDSHDFKRYGKAGFLKLRFVQEPTKFFTGRVQPQLLSFTDLDAMRQTKPSNADILESESWIKFYPINALSKINSWTTTVPPVQIL